MTHTWIAEHYLIHNMFAKAIPHLEQAVKRDPQASRCWNNLAYAIADIHPERLDDALKYADQALKIAPMVPDFHDTRGTILMKQKKYSDAVAAFEQAIECVTKSGGRFLPVPAYHERLAAAYAAAGDADMANTHRDIATKLTAQYQLAGKQPPMPRPMPRQTRQLPQRRQPSQLPRRQLPPSQLPPRQLQLRQLPRRQLRLPTPRRIRISGDPGRALC